MSTVTDDVITTLQLVGVQEYVSGFTRAAAGPDLLSQRLGEFRREQVAAGAAVGIGVGALAFFGRAAFAAADDQVKFNRAVGNFKGSFAPGALAAFTKEIEGLTGIDDDKVADVLGILGTFKINPQDAKALTLPIFNASEALKALGLTAETTANQVGKAIQTGNAGPLRRAGIVIDTDQFKAAATETERVRLVVQALQAQGGEAAAQFRDSLPGALQAFQTALHNAQEEIGKVEVGPLRAIIEGGVAIVNAFNNAPDAVKQFGTAIGVFLATQVTLLGARTFVTLGNTIRLGEAHLQAAANARAQAQAEDQLANSLTRVAARSGAGAAAAGVAGLGGLGAGAAPGVAPAGPAGAAGAGGAAGVAPRAGGIIGLGLAALGLAGPRTLPGVGAPGAAPAAPGTPTPTTVPVAGVPGGRLPGPLAGNVPPVVPVPPVSPAVNPAAAAGFRLNAGAAPGAALAVATGLSFIPPTGNKTFETGKAVAQGALFGGFLGAQVGSILPGAGTAVGAGVGAVAGGGIAFLSEQQREKDQAKAEKEQGGRDPQIALLEKQLAAQQETINLLRGIAKGEVPFATSDIPGSLQVAGLLDSL